MINPTRKNIRLTENNEPGCWTVRKCGHCGLWQWEWPYPSLLCWWLASAAGKLYQSKMNDGMIH
jgi:hypothetical protein